MSAPAQPYGSWVSPRSPLRGGVGIVSFGLGLVVAFAMVVYAAWLAVSALQGAGTVGTAAKRVSGTISSPHGADLAARPPSALLAPTPRGIAVAFEQLWVGGDGNTIVAGAPIFGVSAITGESMIQVPVTLTNNSEQNWNLETTSFLGMLNHAPVAESTEGDWMYRTPIVPHTSITLTKIFVAHPGQFTLKISTPHGTALFVGQI